MKRRHSRTFLKMLETEQGCIAVDNLEEFEKIIISKNQFFFVFFFIYLGSPESYVMVFFAEQIITFYPNQTYNKKIFKQISLFF